MRDDRQTGPHQILERQAGQFAEALSDSWLMAPASAGRSNFGRIDYKRQAACLGRPDLRFVRRSSHPQGAGRQSLPVPVDLLELMARVPDLPVMTALLGLTVNGRPVFFNLETLDRGNILIAGGPAAGKSSLLRTLLLSLAMRNGQARLQLVIVEAPAGRESGRNRYHSLVVADRLPHLLLPVINEARETAGILNFLLEEAHHRAAQNTTQPQIMVAMDDVEATIRAGGKAVLEPLMCLLQNGPEAGIRLILALGEPELAEWRVLLRNNLAVRFVGRVADRHTARAAAGLPGTRAEQLLGLGDFVAVAGANMIRFQAAYLRRPDLCLAIRKSRRQNRPALLARPTGVRPTMS